MPVITNARFSEPCVIVPATKWVSTPTEPAVTSTVADAWLNVVALIDHGLRPELDAEACAGFSLARAA